MKIYLWVLHVVGLVFAVVLGIDLPRGTWVVSLLFGFLSALALWGLISLHVKETYQR